MKARDAEGRRIVKVNQERFWNEHTGSWCVQVTSFDLDNGTALLPMVVETEGSSVIEMVVWRPEKGA